MRFPLGTTVTRGTPKTTIKHQMCQKFVRNAFLAPKYARNVKKLKIYDFAEISLFLR